MIKVLKSSAELLIVQLQEDLKMENAREFYEDFLEVFGESRSEVLVDFQKTKFVDSSGIGILIKCSEKIRDKRAKLFIYGLNRSLATVFKLAGLMNIFDVVEESDAKEKYPELFKKED